MSRQIGDKWFGVDRAVAAPVRYFTLKAQLGMSRFDSRPGPHESGDRSLRGQHGNAAVHERNLPRGLGRGIGILPAEKRLNMGRDLNADIQRWSLPGIQNSVAKTKCLSRTRSNNTNGRVRLRSSSVDS
jgi:hypothetical protein